MYGIGTANRPLFCVHPVFHFVLHQVPLILDMCLVLSAKHCQLLSDFEQSDVEPSGVQENIVFMTYAWNGVWNRRREAMSDLLVIGYFYSNGVTKQVPRVRK